MMHRVPARACAAAEGTGAGAKRGHAEAAAVGGGHDGGSEGEDMGPMPLGEGEVAGAGGGGGGEGARLVDALCAGVGVGAVLGRAAVVSVSWCVFDCAAGGGAAARPLLARACAGSCT